MTTTESIDIAVNLVAVREKIASVAADVGAKEPTLVAVSKTKPLMLLKEAWNAGQRHFGENYVAELVQKGSQLSNVQWHFIGHLQSNKVKALVGVPGLWVVETVDSQKLANTLNKEVLKSHREVVESSSSCSNVAVSGLRVMVQVNTSGESSKSGVSPEGAAELAKHITEQCPGLKFHGLMAIGRSGSTSEGKQDFQTLIACRKSVCRALGVEVSSVEASMGMSSDFEEAVCWAPILDEDE